jgi:alkylation response protein AidB-like acyl-CoA dehydrogenase
MDVAPSEEQVMARDMVRRFLADRYDATSMAKGPMQAEDWRSLGELGLFAFLLPEQVGGMGGGGAEIMMVAEELGRSLAITPLAESVVLCGHLIAHGNPDGSLGEILARGEAIFAFAEGGVVQSERLSGTAAIVRDGMAAQAFLVATEDGTIVLVEADQAAVDRTPVRLVDGSVAAEVRFTDAPAQILVGAEKHLDKAIALAELALVAEMVGAMGTLLDLTVEYVQQRKQFGKPIGSFQAIQHRCARLYALLEQSRSMLTKAALSEPQSLERNVLAARAYVSDAALRLAEDAVQLHGGMGVTEELAVGRGLRRILLLSRLFGGATAARAALAA